MKADPVFRGFKTEMLSFASFYGLASVLAALLFGLVYILLPIETLAAHLPLAVTAAFLAGCAAASVLFERHRKRHRH